jgi:hypothetical protein
MAYRSKYDDVRVTKGRKIKNPAANESAFQLMKATFNIGNLMGDVSSKEQPRSNPHSRRSSISTEHDPRFDQQMDTLDLPSDDTHRGRSTSFNGSAVTSPSVITEGHELIIERRASEFHPSSERSTSPNMGESLLLAVPTAGRVQRSKSVVDEILGALHLKFGSGSQQSSKHTSSRNSTVGSPVSTSPPDLPDVVSGSDYLDNTARLLMNLWNAEEVCPKN